MTNATDKLINGPHLPGWKHSERGWGGMITINDTVQIVIAILLLISLVIQLTHLKTYVKLIKYTDY